MEYRLTAPFTKDKVKDLRAGDRVYVTGTIYTARDAAHKRITEMIGRGEEPPFEIKDSMIYYVGPTPAKPGHPIGSAVTDHKLQDGRIRTYAAGYGTAGDDRQRAEIT